MKENPDKKDDRTTWPVAGGMMIGIGIGFFFVQQNPFALAGCLLTGLGAGLILSSVLHSITSRR